jgi:hypothetical protein
VSIRNTIILRQNGLTFQSQAQTKLENVLSFSNLTSEGPLTVTHCTLPLKDQSLRCRSDGLTVLDSVVWEIIAEKPHFRVEHCDIFSGRPVGLAKPGVGCFALEPQFISPATFNYELAPVRPWLRSASDGGIIGFHYTPELVEMLNLALKLRAARLLAF